MKPIPPIIIFLALCSCNLEDSGQALQLDSGEVVSFHAQFDAVEDVSRTTLGEAGACLWEASDAISLFSTGGSHMRFSLTDGAGTREAVFTGNLISTTVPYYAIYPYREGNSKNNGLRFLLPEVQTYAENSFGRDAAPMYAIIPEINSNASFKNLCGILKLQFTGSAPVTRIVLTSKSGASLWGMCRLVLNNKQGTDEQTLELSEGSATLILDCGDGVQLSEVPTAFHLVVPAGSLDEGMTVEVFTAGDKMAASFSTDKTIPIKRSSITPMKSRPLVTDLSVAESANCYVVTTSGSYCFKSVKGNSGAEIVPAYVDVLWESVNTTTAPSAGTVIAPEPHYDEGYIFFTATGNKGNAVIAAKDASGDVLWSWHIWVPSSVPGAAAYSNSSTGGMMDRDLGALSETPANPFSSGLIYQWGRKDPFPGICGYSTANPEIATTGSFVLSATSAEKGTEDYAIAHPTEYLYCPSSVQGNQDWVYGGNNSHWGAVKTIYDPCPPGYQVPVNGVWAGLEAAPGTNGFLLDGKHWYALTGNRWSSDGSLHGANAMGYWWNATAGTNQAFYGLYDASKGTFTPAKTISRSAGLAVRCYTAETPVPAPDPTDDVQEFLDALPEGVKVSSISASSSTIRVVFSNGSELSLEKSGFAQALVGDDGYWYINGVKSAYEYASNPYYVIAQNGHWYCDGADTGTIAVPENHLLQLPRSVKIRLSDGKERCFEKDIDWGMFVQKTEKTLYVWMGHESSSQWIRHTFSYRYKAYTGGTTYPDYYDNWGLGKPCICTRSGNSFATGEELFLGGEAEAAVQTWDERSTPQKTYSGGVLHGWENIYTEYGNRLISISIDGTPVTETGTVALKRASRIEIEQKTKIAHAYSPAGFDNAYANVVKHWVIENGTVSISVEYTFRKETQIFQAKFGMFCVKRLRTAGDTSSTYVTRLAWKDSTPYKMYDVTEGWESAVPASATLKSRDRNATRVEEYGDAGVSFAMQYDGGTLKSGGGFNIGTNGNNYNKIYFDICGGYTAAQGEKLSSTVHWELDFIADYDKF
ncbi:MAG: hypothetical protein IJS62_05720 [Bacteroidales bacterium]|nr:hypothetical protein [Bacteroidales bacterium]